VPARFLSAVTFDGFGTLAFYDERFDERGGKKEHALNDPRFAGAAILVVNGNFGCGSSREHAPQALMRAGIRAIAGESFAAIFADNCCAIGLPVVCLQKEAVAWIMENAGRSPEAEAEVSIERGEFEYCDKTFPARQEESHRQAFLQGRWDAVHELLEARQDTDRVAQSLPYLAFGNKPKIENRPRALASGASCAEADV